MKILRSGPGPKPPVVISCYGCKSLLEVMPEDAERTVQTKVNTAHVFDCAVCHKEIWVEVSRFRG